VRAGRRNLRRDFHNVTHCIPIPMQARTQWTHSDVWLQLATTPECLFKIGDRQSEKKRRIPDRRAICNATCGFEAGGGDICHRGVSDRSDGARPLWWSHPTRMEIFFADVPLSVFPIIVSMGGLLATGVRGFIYPPAPDVSSYPLSVPTIVSPSLSTKLITPIALL